MDTSSYNDPPLEGSLSSAYPADRYSVTFMDYLLPPQALPLIILLLLILPMAILTGESLFIPLAEWIKSLFTSGSDVGSTSLPLYFFLKLAVFLVLTFFGLVQLIFRINTLYLMAWSSKFPKPHTLHVNYEPDLQLSPASLLNWSVYRLLMVVAPPLVMGVVTFLVGLLEVYLFNLFSGLPFISLPIQFIVAIFVSLLLCLFTGFACLNSVWTLFTTVFGDVIAVTEPELPAKTIYDRCGRIAFSAPLIYVFYVAYFIFLVGILVELYLLVANTDILDVVSFHANIPLILGIEAVTFGLYLVLSFIKFYTYHQALENYYVKLPQQFKERFSSPA